MSAPAEPPGAGSAARPRRPPRAYYAIGEVCEMLGLKPHVLRYWETQFEGLSPTKNRAGARVYRAADVERIALIQRLLHEEKYTIDGARRQLQQWQPAAVSAAASAALDGAFLRTLRDELERLGELLDPTTR